VNAFKRYVVSNPLHPDVFPGMRNLVFTLAILTELSERSHTKNGSRGCFHVSQDVRLQIWIRYSDIDYPLS
jgi:hypothetical protein